MPIRIGRCNLAGGVELGYLFGVQGPANGAEIGAQLPFIAGADDDIADAGPRRQPVERYLRHGLADLFGHLLQGIDDSEKLFVVDRRAAGFAALGDATFCRGEIAADLAGQATPAERRPHHGADALIERQRHQLPLIIAAKQRIIALIGDVARQAVFFRRRQRLHQMPAGIVRRADIANLARSDQIVERSQGFVERCLGIETVHKVQIDMIGAETLQAGLGGADDVIARRALAVGAVFGGEG